MKKNYLLCLRPVLTTVIKINFEMNPRNFLEKKLVSKGFFFYYKFLYCIKFFCPSTSLYVFSLLKKAQMLFCFFLCHVLSFSPFRYVSHKLSTEFLTFLLRPGNLVNPQQGWSERFVFSFSISISISIALARKACGHETGSCHNMRLHY